MADAAQGFQPPGPQRANVATGLAQALQRLGDQPRGGGLAVGAGHAHREQRVGRIAVKARGDHAQLAAQVGDDHRRQLTRHRTARHRLDEHRRGARGGRLGHEVEPVPRTAHGAERHEHIAATHLARVADQTRHGHVGHPGCVVLQQVGQTPVHRRVTPEEGSAADSIICGCTGCASGAICSRRAAPCITSENTGAAT